MEAIKVVVVPTGSAAPGSTDQPFVKNVYCSYQTHVENIGWQGFRNNGEMSGTSGQSLRLEAIQIKLNGVDADKYDIYYQVHAENYGWLDWAKMERSQGPKVLAID